MFSEAEWNCFFKTYETYKTTGKFSPDPVFLKAALEKLKSIKFSKDPATILSDPWLFFEFFKRDDEVITNQVRIRTDWRETFKFLNTRTNPFKIRRFRDNGSYPDQKLIDSNYAYAIHDNQPILITLGYGKKNIDDFFSSYGFWATPLEIKILMGLSMPCKSSLPYFSYAAFSEQIPKKVLLNDNEVISEKTFVKIQDILKVLDFFPNWKDPHYSKMEKNFALVSNYLDEKAKKLIQFFDCENHMQLAAGSLLLRAMNHHARREEVFDEEALVNIVFAMESIYKLFHVKYFNNQKFNKNSVKNKIKEIFTEFPGFDDVVEDAYDKRSQVTHPHILDVDEWRMHLMADDFMESYIIAIELFYFIVTEEKLGWN